MFYDSTGQHIGFDDSQDNKSMKHYWHYSKRKNCITVDSHTNQPETKSYFKLDPLNDEYQQPVSKKTASSPSGVKKEDEPLFNFLNTQWGKQYCAFTPARIIAWGGEQENFGELKKTNVDSVTNTLKQWEQENIVKKHTNSGVTMYSLK
jgi:hypothetical protein